MNPNDHEKPEKPDKPEKPVHLHIFVNRRKFEEGDGVRQKMTGAEIAALVQVPKENAVIRLEGDEPREIGVDEIVHIKNGQHFLVTRRVVEGGATEENHEP